MPELKEVRGRIRGRWAGRGAGGGPGRGEGTVGREEGGAVARVVVRREEGLKVKAEKEAGRK